LRPGWEISLSELVDFLEKKGVARFKLPEFLQILPDLPRVPTGQKIDRKELCRRARELNQRGKTS
jgi:non-ribosomal peptide synthetase component E (peptide arylation enzyme)